MLETNYAIRRSRFGLRDFTMEIMSSGVSLGLQLDPALDILLLRLVPRTLLFTPSPLGRSSSVFVAEICSLSFAYS